MGKISNLLIVASTKKEVSELEQKLTYIKTEGTSLTSYSFNELQIDVLITGIGIPATTYKLTTVLKEKTYNLVINTGICGSFSDDLEIGDSVSVIMDEFADLGVSYPNKSFHTLFEEELIKTDDKPFKNGKLFNPFQDFIDTELPKATAITVSNVSGYKKQIKQRKDKFDPDIETMEGAAVAYVCLQEKINYLQIRTVSNFVEPRNKSHWNIPTAVANLADTVETVLNNINKETETTL